jgi:hypothetical protein
MEPIGTPVTRLLSGLLALSLAGLAAASAADGAVVVLAQRSCKPPTAAQQAWLDDAWKPFAAFIRFCPVARASSRPVLLLASVWADPYYDSQPSGAQTVVMPAPLLFSPEGRRVGELPSNFPSDPPAELRVEFADWKQGYPLRIDLCVSSPTASGDQWLKPLRYQADAGRYAAGEDASGLPQRKHCHGRK